MQKQCSCIPPLEALCLGAEVDCSLETPRSRAAGRFEVAILGPEIIEASTDAQNKEERPQLSTFYLHGRFAAKTNRLVTSEAKSV